MPRSPFCGCAFPRIDALPDTVGKAALTTGHWKRCLTRAGAWAAPAASCPSRLGASHPHALYVCPPPLLARLLGVGSHCLEVLPCPGPSLKKIKIQSQRPIPSPAPPCLAVRGRQAAPCRHPPHSQDIPAREGHARCANPSGNAGIRHQGSVGDPGMGTRSGPGAGKKHPRAGQRGLKLQ